MGDIQGFLKHGRELPTRRPGAGAAQGLAGGLRAVPDRARSQTQASRCMDCGIPFCNNGCPLGNLIPDWNDLVYRDQLAARPSSGCTPPTTSPSSPAGSARRRARPPACSASTRTRSRSSRSRSRSSTGPGTRAGSRRCRPTSRTGKKVAVVGSGPAGLAAAQQLTRAGHDVVVFERADRIGGLLRYGIPEFKMEKRHLDRRLAQMEAEGTEFRTGVERRRRRHRRRAARPSSTPSCSPAAPPLARDLPIPGRELDGIHQAMEYLPLANRVQEGDLDRLARSTPTGKHVVIIGGGDTGADCLGTVAPPGRRERPPVRDHAPAARRPGRRQPVADLAADLPHLLGPRGGRRARVLRQHRALPRRRRRPASGRCAAARGRDGRRPRSRRSRAPTSSSPCRPRAPGHGLRRPRAGAGCSSSSASSSTRAATSARDDELGHQRRRRLRRRRHGPRPEPDRVGHRRGPRRAPPRSTAT